MGFSSSPAHCLLWLPLPWDPTASYLDSKLGDAYTHQAAPRWVRILLSLWFSWGSWEPDFSSPKLYFNPLGGGEQRWVKTSLDFLPLCVWFFHDWAFTWLLWVADWFPELLYSYFSGSLVSHLTFPWENKDLELPNLPSCQNLSIVIFLEITTHYWFWVS